MHKKHRQRIFLGNGDTSSAECYGLVKDLIESFSLLSGLQQGGVDEQAEFFIEDTAKNIYIALTGILIK